MRKLIMVVGLSLALTGCGREHPVTPKAEQVKTTEKPVWQDGCVLLQDVESPKWNKVFAVAESGEVCKSIAWGYSEDQLVMAESSGYPGFGQPILVIGECTDLKGEVQLTTNYGSFYYQCGESQEAVLNDEKDNLISVTEGKPLIEFNKKGECLWLYDKESRTATFAKLLHGTSIVLRQ